MDIKTLERIVAACALKEVRKTLKAQGYAECWKDKRYKDLSLVDICNGEYEETQVFTDTAEQYQYYGTIYTEIKSAPGMEVIEIAKNKIYKRMNKSVPYHLDYYIKEIK